MSKSAAFFIFALIPLYVVAQSPEGSVCLLEDPKNQCGSFCLSVLKPLLDHIAKHQDQWSISDSLGLNETQSKLDRIEGMQLAFEKTVRATMQPTQDMKRDSTYGNQQDILISNGNQTLNKMESQQKLWQQELIEKIAEPRQIFEDLKSALETQIKDLQGKLSSLQNSTVSKSIPVNFQKIANRFFYIERLFQKNWFSASDTCRRMGGQLAIIENEEERRAIAAMVNKQANLAFWLDIHNMANKSEYTSSATGTRPPFIKWGKNQPNLFNEDCVALDDGEMHDYNCASKLFFICQA
ncbi:accessory gland protein Acp29AB-like [Drosophila serrata]|uniref:accessory gland protein Acp29AB-like n=1 Tax=Drosophila serrata TaxID=7274 RepID=UPI000A1D1BA3|nr:accessory gland protein Acp29AB-like [Drosophila serrata]